MMMSEATTGDVVLQHCSKLEHNNPVHSTPFSTSTANTAKQLLCKLSWS